MIEISYQDLNNKLFQDGIRMLGDRPTGLSSKEIFDYLKLKRVIEAETKKVREAYTMLIKKYAKLDENGKPIQLPGGAVEFTNQEDFDKEAEELWQKGIELKCNKFKVQQMIDAKLTPNHIGACSALIEDLPADYEP